MSLDSADVLNTILTVDGELRRPSPVEEARSSAAEYSARLRQCNQQDSLERSECLLAVLLGDDGIQASARGTSLAENTMSAVLADGRGSCAAIVAAVLALTEQMGEPFRAVVLREHVLLESTAAPGLFFEALERGRRLEAGELSRHEPHPPGGPSHVGGPQYVAYYLDNLAARLAEDGQPERAEQAFRQALHRAPRTARLQYNYGTFLVQQRRYAQALTHLDRAIRIGWEEAAAYVNRGAARWKLGRLGAAERDFERALALDPANREAASNLRDLREVD